jgi:hypothetical protein
MRGLAASTPGDRDDSRKQEQFDEPLGADPQR